MMQKIAKKMKQDKLTWTLFSCLLVLLVFNMITVLRGSVEAFHSDSATAILLAREQLRTGQIIPDGWHYANDIWLLSFNLFCIPFMLFLEDWMLCRELAVVVQMLVVTGALVYYLSRFLELKWALLAALLFWSPISQVTREHFLFQATYATIILQTLLILIAVRSFFFGEKKKSMIVTGGMLGVLITIMTMGGIRVVGTTIVPVLGAIAILLLLEIEFDLLKLQEKRHVFTIVKMLFMLLACGIGYGIHLKYRTGGLIDSFSISMTSEDVVWSKLGDLVRYYLRIWGCFEASGLFTVSGVFGFLRFLLCMCMNLVIPIYLLIRNKILQQKETAFFIYYSFFVFIIVLYLMVFTNMYNEYYLLPIYFNGCVLTVIALNDLVHIKKNMSSFFVLICMIPFCMMTGVYQARRNYSRGENDYNLIYFLKENELYFGATGVFWDSCKYTVLSDGKVEIVCYNGEPEIGNLWLGSESWYEPEYYSGKSFILVRNGWEDISEEWKRKATDILTYGAFSIYVYPENIYSMVENN